MATAVFLERFDQSDAKRVDRTLTRVASGITERQNYIAGAVRIWLKESTANPANIKSVSSRLLSDFNLNALMAINADGSTGLIELRGVPEGMSAFTRSDQAALADIIRSLGAGQVQSGLVGLSLGPMLFSAEAVSPSDGSPLAGVVVGIFLTGEYEQKLRNALLSDFSILPATENSLEVFRGRALDDESTLVVPPGNADQQILAYSLLRDFKKKPLIVLRVAEARQSLLTGTASLRFFLGSTAAFGIIVIIFGTLMVELLVTGRIRRLTNSARRVEVSGMDDLAPSFFHGADEISTLAKTMKSMFDRLKSSQVLYRAVVETQTELIVRFRPDGEVVLANEAFAQFFGRHIRGVVGKNIKEFFTESLLGGQNILAQIPTESKRSMHSELAIKREGGEECRLEWNQRALVAEDDTVSEIQAIGHDVTLHREYENKLKKSKEAAEAADRAKSEFLLAMSHDTRTPLNSILGITLILENMPISEELRDYVGLIRSSGNSLLFLLNDLLDYNNVPSGSIEIRPTAVSVADLARAVIAGKTPDARLRNLNLELVLEADAPEQMEVDAVRIRQVLDNLIGNGIRYTEKGFVRLLIKAGEPGKVNFCVQDSGQGIPQGALSSLFQTFWSSDTGKSQRHHSTGMGLAFCWKVLKLMGGEITVRSEIGIGSLFTVTLPVGNPEVYQRGLEDIDQESRDVAVPKPDFTSYGLRALVVDDNLINQKVLRRLLGIIGIPSDAVSSGYECLDQLPRQHYDIVFMDVQMPDMDGFETVARIRQAALFEAWTRTACLIACTAFSLPGDREKCLAAGMDYYLSKPLRMEALRNVICAFLETRSADTKSTKSATAVMA